MKNILKYTLISAFAVASFASCQEFEEFGTTIDGYPPLAYVEARTYNTTVLHTSIGSFGTLEEEFYIQCSGAHDNDIQITMGIDPSLIAAYNEANKTSYAALPEGFLQFENAQNAILAGKYKTENPVKLTLTGDLSKLTNPDGYLAPISVLSVSGMSASVELNKVYVRIDTEINSIRKLTSLEEIGGTLVADRSAWTATTTSTVTAGTANLMFDGNNSTKWSFKEIAPSVVIDLQKTLKVGGLFLRYADSYYPPNSVNIYYSTDGTNFQQMGRGRSNNWLLSNTYDITIAPYGSAQMRYIKIECDNCKSIAEFNVYTDEFDGEYLYTKPNNTNTFNGVVAHTPVGSFGSVTGSFTVRASQNLAAAVTVNVEETASLVAAYNTANGTSYETLPAGYVVATPASVTLAAGSSAAETPVVLSLTGDMTKLTKPAYLAVLKLKSSAQVSSTKGLVYVIITTEINNCKDKPTAEDFPAANLVADRSGWTATSTDQTSSGSAADLFDGNTNTLWKVANNNTPNMTVDLGKEYTFQSMQIASKYTDFGEGYRINSMKIEYSTDGVNYMDAGTAKSNNFYLESSKQSLYLYSAITARYIKLNMTYGYYYGWQEFNIYEKK